MCKVIPYKKYIPDWDACQDGDVKLVDGHSTYEGRVDVCIGQRWGTVCNTGWSTEDAHVVCRQLGYPPTGSWLYPNSLYGYQCAYCMQYYHVVILQALRLGLKL